MRFITYVRFFVFFRDSTSQELYYSDLRRKMLDSLCDQQEVLFLQLAAAALQAELGDAEEQILGDGDEQNGKENTIVSEKKQNQNYFLPEDYFPSWVKCLFVFNFY